MGESVLFVLRVSLLSGGFGTYRVVRRATFGPWRRVSRIGEAALFLIENLTGLAGATIPARAPVRVDSRDARTQRQDWRGV